MKHPPIGGTWRVRGHWAGDFIGHVIAHGFDTAVVEVIDPLRDTPADACPFPRCGLSAWHDGDHQQLELSIRHGSLIEVPIHTVELQAVEVSA